MATLVCGAQARVAEARSPNATQAYGHDLDAMQVLVNTKTRVIFIANPNNPTGTWLASDELKHFIEQVPEHIAIVIDEAYFEYVDLEQYPDSLQWLEQHPNLIVTRTFSKIYGIAGLRIGYGVSSPELCDLFNRVRQPFNGNTLALAAAEALPSSPLESMGRPQQPVLASSTRYPAASSSSTAANPICG